MITTRIKSINEPPAAIRPIINFVFKTYRIYRPQNRYIYKIFGKLAENRVPERSKFTSG